MRTVLVRYKTTEEGAAPNEALVQRRVRRAARPRARGIRYATYRLADGVSFLHVATVESRETNPLVELPAFLPFRRI